MGMSLRELARRAGVTPSYLSKLERGLTNCSVDTLWMVSEELGIATADLFAGERHSEVEAKAPSLSSPAVIALPPVAFRPVVDPAAREKITMGGVLVENLTPHDEGAMEFIQTRLEVGAGDEEACHHCGHEYGLVLQGRILVQVGFAKYELGPGWSIAFDSSNPHRVLNIGEEPAIAVWVITGRNQA
jgi:transcriptional regulator with XRE-family HTH domain